MTNGTPKKIDKIEDDLRANRFRYYISIEPTSLCNLRCPICPYEQMIDKVQHMDWELFTRIVDQYDSIPERRGLIYLGGLGEPFLYKHIFKAIDYIRAKGIKVGINTNATYLNDSWIEKILNADINYLTVSLNGFTPESYAVLSGNNHHEQVVENAQKILMQKKERKLSNPEISLQFLQCKFTEGEEEEFKKFWRPHMTRNDHFHIRPIENQGGQISINWALEDNPVLKADKRYPCMYLWNFFSFDVEGFIYPCCKGFMMDSIRHSTTSKLKLANIKEIHLSELVVSAKLKQLQDGQLNNNYQDMPECLNCDSFKCYPREEFVQRDGKFDFTP